MTDLFARRLRKGEVAHKKTNAISDLVLILDDVYDTFNVGGMYRVSDAAGVSKIYHCGTTPLPDDPKIQRASVGLTSYINWEYVKDIKKLIEKLRAEKYTIISLEQSEKSVRYDSVAYKGKTALVVGNETFGVKPEIVNSSDIVIELPMFGVNKSLNVAVATGISLYEIRQRLSQ